MSSVERCNREPLGGGQCERPKGHDGKHERTFPSGAVFEWDDESQARLYQQHGSRYD